MDMIIIVLETLESSGGVSALIAGVIAIVGAITSVISWPIVIAETFAGISIGDFSGIFLICLFLIEILIAVMVSNPGFVMVSFPVTYIILGCLNGVDCNGIIFITYLLGFGFMGFCMSLIPAAIISFITS